MLAHGDKEYGCVFSIGVVCVWLRGGLQDMLIVIQEVGSLH